MVNVIALVGRILLALIFLLSGVSKIGDYAGTVAYMSSHGIPLAPALIYCAVIVEIGGAISLMTGFRARWGALILALYLIPVTYLFHYRPTLDPMALVQNHKLQMIMMLKNIAIIGGLLLVYGNGAGKLTIGKDH